MINSLEKEEMERVKRVEKMERAQRGEDKRIHIDSQRCFRCKKIKTKDLFSPPQRKKIYEESSHNICIFCETSTEREKEEKFAAWRKNHYEINKEEINRKRRKWYADTKDKRKISRDVWMKSIGEEGKGRLYRNWSSWYEKNKEQHNEKRRAKYKEKREVLIQQNNSTLSTE